MHSIDIQAKLRKRQITQKAIAEELNVSQMAVSKVVNKLIVSDRIMRAVAEKLNLDYRQVFPEYYLKPAKRRTSKVSNI